MRKTYFDFMYKDKTREEIMEQFYYEHMQYENLYEEVSRALDYMNDHFYYKDGLLITIPVESDFDRLKHILQNALDGE